MVTRITEEQRVHDDIIILIEKQYRKEYPYVFINLENKKKAVVKSLGIYPDIIIGNKDKKIILIEEVETESTVTKGHAMEQWRDYSKGRYGFIIRVPYGVQDKAAKIIEQLGIEAEIKWYRAAPSGYSIEY
jgi:hypothetical protein